MPPVVHERLACPRCRSRGARELNRLPEEGHAVFMCPFCKHTWCQAGIAAKAAAAPGPVPGALRATPPGVAEHRRRLNRRDVGFIGGSAALTSIAWVIAEAVRGVLVA